MKELSIQELYHQQACVEYITNTYGKEDWVQVAGSKELYESDANFWCGIVEENHINSIYNSYGWDVSKGTDGPGFMQTGGETLYKRCFGDDEGHENIVHYREFFGVCHNYYEISEEFRLLFNLFYNEETKNYYEILENGELEEAIKIEEDKVYIRLKHLVRYIAAKQKVLLLFFDIRYSFDQSMEDLGLEQYKEEYKTPELFYGIWGGNSGVCNDKAFSVMMGKKIIYPKPVESSGFWPYESEGEYQEFIVGIDDSGEPILHTSNPKMLSNMATPEKMSYLTPVFFKKEVLQKYYSKPEVYSINDGYLKCGYLWGIRIDNHLHNCIGAYLGDLGRDLPCKEEIHWKQYNIHRDGGSSKVRIMREMLGCFAPPEIIDLKFKNDYILLNDAWEKEHGWPLFIPLEKDDKYNFSGLRIPITNSQEELDALILSLVKVLIDSLNEKQLSKEVKELKKDAKGIDKLETWVKDREVNNSEIHIRFLRNLQQLRSRGSGHRKGSSYHKLKQEMNLLSQTKERQFEMLLEDSDSVLRWLGGLLMDNPFSEKTNDYNKYEQA